MLRSINKLITSRDMGTFKYSDVHNVISLISSHAIPWYLKEKEIKLQSTDKIFAVCWIGPNMVACGTKDNKFLVFDISGYSPVQQIELPLSSSPPAESNFGIHSITISKSNRYIASGALNPNDVAIFERDTMKPFRVLTGHKDWSFSAGFLTEDRVVSGSRDFTVSVWDIGTGDSFERTPLQTSVGHNGKVRALTIKDSETFFTMGLDGQVLEWNSDHLKPVQSWRIENNLELNSMAMSDDSGLIGVGSKKGFNLIDPRMRSSPNFINSIDPEGVRSITFVNHVTTLGGASGCLAFYDLRMNDYMTTNNEENPKFLRIGDGVLNKDEFFNTYFAHSESIQRNAILAHAYNEDNTKLFLGGGPLITGINGCYAGLW
eukprot:TRINITY_DN6153_c1_g1_i1.p1 TRINITY_DN6153_c1_g1~~TRINITY_DN6153_c1_g1_i1.p1  ORF type:complete len:375 (+),score=34.82 TRINITY_DN6153_c1_g1_i1:802-1926(+)